MEQALRQAIWSEELPGDQPMHTPEDVQAMLKLASLGWGAKRIAAELGCSRNTVRRYLRQGGWQTYRASSRPRVLAEHAAWLKERFLQHRGNCDVVRQDLQRELSVTVSLRTVERAAAHLRRELQAQNGATIRFETPPGHQLQIDFGTVRVFIGEQEQKIHLFVATLGYSRRCYVAAFTHERQSAWLHGLEGAFGHFGGTSRELLLDNARALVDEHDAQTREVRCHGLGAAVRLGSRFHRYRCPRDLASSFDTLHSVQMRVGALPAFPTNALKVKPDVGRGRPYQRYCHECESIHDGRLTKVLPLEGLEHFSLDGTEYEAFNTSGGLGTLCETLEGRVRNLDDKTVRYRGHRSLMTFLLSDLQLSSDQETRKTIMRRSIHATTQDVVIVFVKVSDPS